LRVLQRIDAGCNFLTLGEYGLQCLQQRRIFAGDDDVRLLGLVQALQGHLDHDDDEHDHRHQ
jgi:hypothetical protein